ncbi:anthocyanin 5-aromatic acyltransferase [Rosa sericea]
MAQLSKLNVIEQCQVSTPQNSSTPQACYHLPLTFLDIPWLFFSPSQPLFFYEFPYPTSHFTSITLPNLKHSLSLTLQLFYPFAGALLARPEPGKPELVYSQGDSVAFTVVESNADFGYLSGNYQRDVEEFNTLVPQLASTGAPSRNCAAKIPLLSVQITLFPNCGICIGLAYHHVVADERTFNNFIKTWASFSRHSFFPSKSILPSYDRKAIVDPYALEGIFLKEWWKRISSKGAIIGNTKTAMLVPMCMVRATFLMDLNRMERIKNWIANLCNKGNEPLPVHLSAYVLTCAFVWISLIKSQEKYFNYKCCGQDQNYFGFIAGGLTRLNHPVPSTYVGNCVGFGQAAAIRSELLGDNGIVVAARAIGNTVKKLDKAIFGGAEKWISDCKVMFESELHVMVSGSPKVDLYETDFGLGRPKKIEDVGVDGTKAIALTESRDVSGGIEVGLVLPKPQMDYFSTFFIEGLNATP